MKSKILALSKNEEFKSLLKQKKISNKYVTIFFGKLANKDKDKLNISFVTKKKIGNAVNRNKIKRRLRVIAKNIIGEYGIKNWNYVIIGKKNSLIEDFKNLEFEMNTAIKKIHS